MPRTYSKSDLALLAKEGLSAALPAPKMRKARSSPEWQIQFQLFKWWKGYCRTIGLPECLLFAIPNGAALSGGNAEWQKKERGRKGAMLKMTGLTAGVADCFLAHAKVRKDCDFMPHLNRPVSSYGLFIELKSPTGIVSDDQRTFRAAVVAQGYQHCVATSAEAAIQVITDYLK